MFIGGDYMTNASVTPTFSSIGSSPRSFSPGTMSPRGNLDGSNKNGRETPKLGDKDQPQVEGMHNESVLGNTMVDPA